MPTLTKKRIRMLLGPNALDPGAQQETAAAIKRMSCTNEDRAELWDAVGELVRAAEPAEPIGIIRVPRPLSQSAAPVAQLAPSALFPAAADGEPEPAPIAADHIAGSLGPAFPWW
jgi:hypothetical protein